MLFRSINGNLLLSSTQAGSDIAVYSSGNAYVTGTNLSIASITKLNANFGLQWTREATGDSSWASDIALDSAGNPVATGRFMGTVDFNPATGKANVYSLFSGGRSAAPSTAAFVWKLNASGNFTWARHFQASTWGASYGQGIVLDSSNNVYTTGYFFDTADFNPGSGKLNLTSAGQEDAFVSKLDSSGNFLWARAMGGSSHDSAYGIALDSTGNVYTTGEFESTNADFDPGSGTAILQTRGGADVFVSKLNSSGNYSWAGQMGGAGSDYGRGGIVVNASNRVTAAGFFASGAESDFDPGPGLISLDSGASVSGYEAMFVSSFSIPAALQAAGMGLNQGLSTPLSSLQVSNVLPEALHRWQAVGVDTSRLASIDIRIADLGGTVLGQASGSTIWLDDNAAGWGWFVDPTPGDDSEFTTPGDQGEQNRMDLLSVLMHEVGHVLGHEHEEVGVMQETLSAGERLTQHGIDVNDFSWFIGLPDLLKKRDPFAWWL